MCMYLIETHWKPGKEQPMQKVRLTTCYESNRVAKMAEFRDKESFFRDPEISVY